VRPSSYFSIFILSPLAFDLQTFSPSQLLTFYISNFRIFSRGIVPPYRTTTGPTSDFKSFHLIPFLSSNQYPASSIEYRVSSIQHQVSSIQHPASNIQEITAEATRKPNSVPASGYPEVGNDHSSKGAGCPTPLATYPEAWAGSPQTLPYLVLHRVGFTELPRSPGELVRSYRTVSPLPADVSAHREITGRYTFCCTFLRVATTSRYEAPCPVVFGLSSEPKNDPAIVWITPTVHLVPASK
jgi:hypothetical protein